MVFVLSGKVILIVVGPGEHLAHVERFGFLSE